MFSRICAWTPPFSRHPTAKPPFRIACHLEFLRGAYLNVALASSTMTRFPTQSQYPNSDTELIGPCLILIVWRVKLSVIGLTLHGIELPTFHTGTLCSTNWVIAFGVSVEGEGEFLLVSFDVFGQLKD